MVRQGPPVVRLSNQVLTDLPGLYIRMEILTYQRSATKSAARPLMTGGTYLCLSVVLVINSFTII